MKKFLIILSIFMVLITAFIIYWNNDSWMAYNLQKRRLSTLDLIKDYTRIKFPNSTKIESYRFKEDTPIFNDECLKATLLVPTSEIANLFPEKIRDYNISRAVLGDDKKNIYFSALQFSTVKKWLDKTQRSIHFTVIKPKNNYSKVYISIDKLGWHMWNSYKLSGRDLS